MVSTVIQTEFGAFKVTFHKTEHKDFISFTYGDVSTGQPIIRIHSSCLFGESFHSLHCDCQHQLTATMEMIVKNGNGVIIYAYDEGRGIGLENKIKAMEVERTKGIDTVAAFAELGFDNPDLRSFELETQVLTGLNVSKTIKSFSGNPKKRQALENASFSILEEFETDSKKLSKIALNEKKIKKDKMGYTYKND